MTRYILCLYLLLPIRGLTQDLSALFKQALQWEMAFKEDDALLKYKEILRLQPHNVEALVKCSDLCCRIGNRQPDKAKKTDYYKFARSCAGTAYSLEPKNSEVNIVMALSIARMALMQGGKDKVVAAGDVKRYAENAIRADSNNFKAYHILGRWNYEVSALNIFERTLAKWFYGALPPASLKESIFWYEKSMSKRPGFMLNYLELAKACHRDGQKARALQLLHKIPSLTDVMLDDQNIRIEAKKLLADWE